MKSLLIDKIGGLQSRYADDQISPGNAAVAQYWDPFRDETGKIAPCYGFANHSGFANSHVLAVFELGGIEFYITSGNRGPDYKYDQPRLWYYDTVAAIYREAVTEGLFRILPRRIVVDSNVYIWKHPAGERREYHQAYIFGKSKGVAGADPENERPRRVILREQYDSADVLISTDVAVIDCAFDTLPDPFDLTVSPGGGTPADFPVNNEYTYIVILEDVFGNLISKQGNAQFEVIFNAGASGCGSVSLLFHLNFRCAAYGIKKIHVYRADKTTADADGIDSGNPDHHFNVARWLKTFDLDYNQSMIGHYDYNGADDNLGDLIYPTRNVRKQWITNINLAWESAGIHRGALWCSYGNDIFFSQYDLQAPFGVRPLNLPTGNRWRFEDIGQITDPVSTGDALYILGTRGVSMLVGTDLYNFIEKKISDIGTRWPDVELGEWDHTAVVVGSRVFFVDDRGRPCVIEGISVRPIEDVLLERKGTPYSITITPPKTITIYDPIDVCRYRNGVLFTNGSTIYVYDLTSGNWYEWPQAVRRFIQGFDPFYEKVTASTSAASEYVYFRFITTVDGHFTREYRTRTAPLTAVWQSPRLRFPQDQRYDILTFLWQYNDSLPYGGKDADGAARAAQAVVGTVNYYLDDRLDAVKTVDFQPLEQANGYYKHSIRVNCRGRRFAWRLNITAGKYFHLCGWELTHEPLGRKSFE